MTKKIIPTTHTLYTHATAVVRWLVSLFDSLIGSPETLFDHADGPCVIAADMQPSAHHGGKNNHI